jgi:uncharacterized iron-regulated membrane protein
MPRNYPAHDFRPGDVVEAAAEGSFGLPPAAASRRATLTVLAVIATAGTIYPLVGLSMLAVLVVERLYHLSWRGRERRASMAQ